MPDPALGKYFVVRANTVCCEATGASSKYYEEFEEAREAAVNLSRRYPQQKFAVARILTVIKQELGPREETIEE